MATAKPLSPGEIAARMQGKVCQAFKKSVLSLAELNTSSRFSLASPVSLVGVSVVHSRVYSYVSPKLLASKLAAYVRNSKAVFGSPCHNTLTTAVH